MADYDTTGMAFDPGWVYGYATKFLKVIENSTEITEEDRKAMVLCADWNNVQDWENVFDHVLLKKYAQLFIDMINNDPEITPEIRSELILIT